MRSSVFAIALLAASAVASPIRLVREVVDTDVVYVTQTFYVTPGEQGYRKHRHTQVQTQSSPVVVVTETPPPPTPEVPAQTPAAPSPDATPSPSSTPSPAPSSAPSGNDYITDAVNSHNVQDRKS